MKEYTILSLLSVLATFITGNFFKTGIFKKRLFWIFILIILCFKFMVNGFLTGTGIVIYDPKFYLGLRVGSIPVEDFLFGFSMVALSIIFWEHFKKPCK